MQIKELAKRANLSAKTIRYYESIGLLPAPCRQSNNYRDYDEEDVARVKFVVAARNLGLSLAEIADLLSFRDQQKLSDPAILNFIQHKADEVAQHIADLQSLETELRQLHTLGLSFPDSVIDNKNCERHRSSK